MMQLYAEHVYKYEVRLNSLVRKVVLTENESMKKCFYIRLVHMLGGDDVWADELISDYKEGWV